MEPIARNIDDAENWSLSWHPEGRCDRFTQEAIRAHAPPTSGVYGLFNFHCQVFIGESANIQEALLRHERETDFQSRHLRPTGFTFEPCAAELRKQKTAKLIETFRPVLQNQAALTEVSALSKGQLPNNRQERIRDSDTTAAPEAFPEKDSEKAPEVRRRSRHKPLGVVLGATFLACAAYGTYSGSPNIVAQLLTNMMSEMLPASYPSKSSTPGATEGDRRPENKSFIDPAEATPSRNTEITPTKPPLTNSANDGDDRVMLVAKGNADAEETGIKSRATGAKESYKSSRSNSGKKWSVQIAAATEKDTADALLRQVKAKGYDGYITSAEVKGKTYFRVRIGPFDERKDAESTHKTLAQAGGYQKAYLTSE